MQNNNHLIELLKQVSLKENEDELQQYFHEVAKYLFQHVVIKTDDNEFRFVEVEFYYYQKGKFEGALYNCTYPRTRNAGRFFWHYSGIDICFKSDEEKEFFGGILIRSLKNKRDEIIAGPMRCSDELMNSCKDGLPQLEKREEVQHVEPEETIRYGIKADKEQPEQARHFCFYVKSESWNRRRENVLVADQESGGYNKVSKTDYYTAKPEKR